MVQAQDLPPLEKEASDLDGLEFSQFPSSPLAKPRGSATIKA